MRRAVVGFAGIAPLLALLLLPRSLAAAAGVLMLSHALILYPTLRPNVQWLGPVVTRFETNANEVWLTIDDGPADDTPALLDALDERSVKATFFVKGALAAARPDLLREIARRGHTIGNHSQTHPSATFWCLPARHIAAEIDTCSAVIPPTPLFRAPVGMKNPFVHPHLDRRGMKLIGWSVRGFDATRDAEEKVAARIVPRVKPGSIVVMHQGRSWSVRTISRVVDELRARGFTFVIPNV